MENKTAKRDIRNLKARRKELIGQVYSKIELKKKHYFTNEEINKIQSIDYFGHKRYGKQDVLDFLKGNNKLKNMPKDKSDKIQNTLDQILGELKKINGYFDWSRQRIEQPAISDPDKLYEEAKEWVIKNKKASATFIQRKFYIGYARAAKLLDTMEDEGIIGPVNGTKPRDILVEK